MKNITIKETNPKTGLKKRIVIRLPGIIILAIAVLGFLPSVSVLGLNFIQENVSFIGKALLTLVALLLTVSPNTVWQLIHVSVAEANMKIKENELEKREHKIAALERYYNYAENAISAGNVTQWLDCDIRKIYWLLSDKSFPYAVVQFDVTSRFVRDLIFDDTKQVQFKLTIANDKNEKWPIAKQAMLIGDQLDWSKVEEAREFSGYPHIIALSHNALNFRFDLDGYTRDNIQANYKGIGKVQLEFSVDWKLKTAYDKRIVNFYLPSPIVKEFDIGLD